MMSRSLRPRQRPEPGDIDAVSRVLASLPPGMDLLLPGSARDLGDTLVGYRPDLMVVFGLNWRLPREVLDLPRFGVLNVHQSALPRYRGPAPVLWAIRNGDPTIGVTVHRMDEGFDTGPVMEQVGDVPLPEDATPASVWERTGPVMAELLQSAVRKVLAGDPGTPQDEGEASYAALAPAEWREIDWTDQRERIHHQLRVLRYMASGAGPTVRLGGREVRVAASSLTPAEGQRVECGDGPLWIRWTEPAED
jgi:methionyl-tRNA formyltransferase